MNGSKLGFSQLLCNKTKRLKMVMVPKKYEKVATVNVVTYDAIIQNKYFNLSWVSTKV